MLYEESNPNGSSSDEGDRFKAGSMAETSRQSHFLVVLSCILFVSVSGGCPVGRFGSTCEYSCHCGGGKCDELSGHCSGGCARGWSGPSCQKQNIALKSPASQSSVLCDGSDCFNASLSVDGHTTGYCSSTKKSSYNEWQVSWIGEHYVSRLVIYSADCCPENLNGFRVNVEQKDGTSVQCFQDEGTGQREVIRVRCDKPVLGTSVKITLSTGQSEVALKLCEVEVYACAPGWYGDDCEKRCSGPDCQQCDPFGTVCEACKPGRFGADCSGECHCYDGDACERQNGSCPGKGKKVCAKGWVGSSCTKACPDYRYGVDCNKTCGQCRDRSVCLRENGSCPTSLGKPTCQPGYYKRKCVRECLDGRWGADCMYKCGNCGTDKCDPKSGVCTVRQCQDGWHGERCDLKVCDDGKFGQKCEKSCGQCNGDVPCNKTSGHCPPGSPRCQPGYTGATCLANCSTGFYGADCGLSCGKCYKSITCDRVSGACPNQAFSRRCQAGWEGDMCLKECLDGFYGVDCKMKCSEHCVEKSPCDRVTGACRTPPSGPRCEQGYTGEECKTGCAIGSYGADCAHTCGQCSQDSCEPINGTCPQIDSAPRCKLGYMGVRCNTSCTNGTYGEDCLKGCHCRGGNPCDKSGWCPTGKDGVTVCELGWKGPKCDTACPGHKYGEGCRLVCGHCRDLAECNVRTGACPESLANVAVCQEGWTGERCDLEDGSGTNNTVLLVCIGVACAVVLAATSIFLIFYLRRRNLVKTHRRQANGDDPQQLFNLLSPEERNGSAAKSELKGNKKRFLLGKTTEESSKVTPIISTRTVKVSELFKFISSQAAVEELKKEHELLPKGLTANTTEANKPENKPKNRFQGIVAYDHSRVVLNLKDAVPCSDYINACFVHGYHEQFRYIASQGPTALILDDFWRMIWQFDCTRIIMLTNLVEDARRKCDLYWPADGDKKFGDVTVTLLETEAYADFTIRTFNVSNELDLSVPSRIVKQFHFTAWPDHGVPHYPTALVHFREKVHTTNTTGTGPLVVHCSAGIGRTGTFIGLDYLIDQAKAEDQVDVLHCVLHMRKQRVNMIQTEEQYAFLYESLAEAVLLSNMSIEASKFESRYKELQAENPDLGKSGLQEQFEMLASMSPTVTEKECVGACLPENLHRNRDPSVLAVDHWRPFLSTQWSGTTDYINAVFLPAYRDNCAFIATQMPLPHTTVDMWRLVHGQKSHCILMLNDLEALEDEQCVYWPYDNTTEGMFGPYKIQVVGVEKKSFYDVQTMTMVYSRMPDKEPLLVKQFVAKFWPEGEDVPAKAGDLVVLLEEVERWRQQCGEGPIIVHCMNGADKCGLLCAVSGILERLKIDQEVNILQTVKQMRINRPQVIKNLTQYQFCFDAVVAFLDTFQTYSNYK